MEAAQVALFANGYRPSESEGGRHMTMVQSLVHTIGVEPTRMRVLDSIRHTCNAIDYSGEDVVPSELREALSAAKALLVDARWYRKPEMPRTASGLLSFLPMRATTSS
jgi:hypothetical protein